MKLFVFMCLLAISCAAAVPDEKTENAELKVNIEIDKKLRIIECEK